MRNLYRSLLLIIASSTQRELARQVRYLKIENQILRSRLPKQIRVTVQERNRLIRFGAQLGKALDELVTIVHPGTLRRWIRERRRGRALKPVKCGRRPTALSIRRLVLRLARETGWGYTRILGELKKLGIGSLSRNTVKNILLSHGHDPGPKRGPGTWDEFLKMHAASLWQCDFFSKRVLTPRGFRELFALACLHVGTRRVYVSPATFHPQEAWVKEQAGEMLRFAKRSGLSAELIMHDRDGKFTAAFDAELRRAGLRVRKSPFRSPNTCAYVERFIQTLKQEVLDYFVVFGQRHLDYLIEQAVEHYHLERPHQGLDNRLLVERQRRGKRSPPVEEFSPATIRCRTRLGGLLKHYYRAAA